MVLDSIRKSIGMKFRAARERRARARLEERTIIKIAATRAAAAGRRERVALAQRNAVQKERIIARQELQKFKDKRKRKPAFNLGGGGGLLNRKVDVVGNFSLPKRSII